MATGLRRSGQPSLLAEKTPAIIGQSSRRWILRTKHEKFWQLVSCLPARFGVSRSRPGQGVGSGVPGFIDHRGLVANTPLRALAQLQLARAYVVAGDNLTAKQRYEGFIALWKDADPNVPVVQQAQAEYATLRRYHITN